MRDYLAELHPGCIYHVYNHGNGSEPIFFEKKHYAFFLKQYHSYIGPIAETYCYCLMRSHFHILLRMRATADLESFFARQAPLNGRKNGWSLSDHATQRFSNLFNSYTKAINKDLDRMGSLFMRPFRRILITDEHYLRNLVRYIHRNPVEAGLSRKPQHYAYSSYRGILNGKSGIVSPANVIGLFESIGNFIAYNELQHSDQSPGYEMQN